MIASFGKMAAAAAAAFAIREIVNFSKSAIQLASDLQEVQNVVDVTFGAGNKIIENFAKTSIKSFGLSRIAAKKYMSSIGAMGKSMGFASAQNEQMSTTITGLIGDFASFRNVSADEAFTAMAAIYTGETETLKKYGILITETNLQEYARTQGITKSMSAMTQQEKVMLRYSYVLKATNDAQGDFVRTSGSWANQTRVLTEQWKEFQTLMGQGLIQMLTPALKLLNMVLEKLVAFARVFSAVTSALFGKQIAVASSGEAAADAQTGLADATEEAGKAAKKALAPFDDLNVLQQETAAVSSIPGGSTPLTSPVSAVVSDTESFKLPPEVQQWIDDLKKKFEKLQPAIDTFKNAWNTLKDAMAKFLEDPYVKALLDFFAKFATESLFAGISGLIKVLAGGLLVLSGNIKGTLGLWHIMIGTFKGDQKEIEYGMSLVKEGVDDTAKGIILAGQGIIEGNPITVLSNIAKNDDSVNAWMKQDVEPNFKKNKWNEFWFNVGVAWVNGWNSIKTWWKDGGVKKLWNDHIAPWFTKEKWQTLWYGVATAWSIGWTAIKKYWNESGLAKLWKDNIAPWFTVEKWKSLWDGAIDGLKKGWQGVLDWWNGSVFGALFGKIGVSVVPASGGGGGKSFGAPTVPKLAGGAVIPPRSEFAAILGDQSSGMNIETPESLLRQIYREEGGQSNDLLRELISAVREGKVMVVDKTVLGKVVNKSQGNSFRSAGMTTVPV